ncbi:MAG: aminopeptidase [Ignavibacteriales bacterium]|nr:MAG: aminopeptidase [Ignavibacteriales bacterium]
MKKFYCLTALVLLVSFTSIPAQNIADSIYTFTKDYEVKYTPIKNQARTGTCWCFSTVSFLESEAIRKGKGEFDLSEMYVVRNTYPKKADNYVRKGGTANFGEGGQAHDVINQIKEYGIVPEEVYTGLNIDEPRHNHGELSAILDNMLKAIVGKKGGKLTPRWKEAFNSVLDVYLGKTLDQFDYKGKTYTPKSFLKDELEINPADYVELTSYTHHPFYNKIKLEIPDNWTDQEYYNLPFDKLVEVMDNALENDYSVEWDGDVSEKFFNQKKGFAVVPLKNWDDMSGAEREEKITKPIDEKIITQELRQKAFDNYSATDDHLMHIVGLYHDQKGNKFYYTKNSWGTDFSYGGFIYMSQPYISLNTIAIMVHKDAVPKDIREKLGF